MRYLALVAALIVAAPTLAQDAKPGAAAPPAAAPAAAKKTIVETLQAQAEAVRPLAKTDAVRCFLHATSLLPDPGTRTVWRDRAKGLAYSQAEYDKLDDAAKAGLTKREFPPEFYYLTGYGSPLMYARPLDIYAQASGSGSFFGVKIADFGYGTIGHLRLLGGAGARSMGIDVEPAFRALYSEPGDTGDVPPDVPCGGRGKPGRVEILTGRWPAEPDIAAGLTRFAGESGLDLFMSKNTLKRGYIHPARAVDEKYLVKLGVDDEAFCRAVFGVLRPGGHFLIYNLSPAQNPEDKPYLPHADGQCPFDRSLLERVGFEVIEFDHDERDTALDYWMALGFNAGKTREETRKDLFAWYTLCRRPANAEPTKK